MKTKRNVLLFTACVFLLGIAYVVRTVYSVNSITELLAPNTEWVCENYDASFSVDDDGVIEGVLVNDGEEQGFCLKYREGYSCFYYCSEEDTYQVGAEDKIFLEAGIRAKSGKLYFDIKEDKWNLGLDKLVFSLTPVPMLDGEVPSDESQHN